MANDTKLISEAYEDARHDARIAKYRLICDKFINFCADYTRRLKMADPASIWDVTPCINSRFTENWTMPMAEEEPDNQNEVIEQFYHDQSAWFDANADEDAIILGFIRMAYEDGKYAEFVNDDS